MPKQRFSILAGTVFASVVFVGAVAVAILNLMNVSSFLAGTLWLAIAVSVAAIALGSMVIGIIALLDNSTNASNKPIRSSDSKPLVLTTAEKTATHTTTTNSFQAKASAATSAATRTPAPAPSPQPLAGAGAAQKPTSSSHPGTHQSTPPDAPGEGTPVVRVEPPVKPAEPTAEQIEAWTQVAGKVPVRPLSDLFSKELKQYFPNFIQYATSQVQKLFKHQENGSTIPTWLWTFLAAQPEQVLTNAIPKLQNHFLSNPTITLDAATTLAQSCQVASAEAEEDKAIYIVQHAIMMDLMRSGGKLTESETFNVVNALINIHRLQGIANTLAGDDRKTEEHIKTETARISHSTAEQILQLAEDLNEAKSAGKDAVTRIDAHANMRDIIQLALDSAPNHGLTEGGHEAVGPGVTSP